MNDAEIASIVIFLPSLQPVVHSSKLGAQKMIDRPKSSPKFFTIAQVADFLEVSTRSVRRWVAEGLLVAHRINGLVRISEADFQVFLATHRDN
jgi:excisionase family DNA binding protein